jgi:hypothetical protein
MLGRGVDFTIRGRAFDFPFSPFAVSGARAALAGATGVASASFDVLLPVRDLDLAMIEHSLPTP